MEQLPVELVEKILISDVLVPQDVINFSLTSKYFQNLIFDNNTVWKSKFIHKFARVWNKLKDKPVSYYYELRHVYILKNRIRSILDDMAKKCYKKLELSSDDLREWLDIVREKWDNYFYLVEDLMNIINTPCNIHSLDLIPVNTPGNLTQKYYAATALRYIRQEYLYRMWLLYVRLPFEQRLLENGAIIVAQWCQPNFEIESEVIHNRLDHISKMVESELQKVYPDHPVLKATKEQRELWKSTVRPDNEWSPKDCYKIIDILNQVLFHCIGFMSYSGQLNSLSVAEESYFYINKVLEKRIGTREMLAIIYDAVARRLGLKFEPIFISSSHFFLRFSESQLPGADWYYIDVSREGQILKRGACPFSRNMSAGPRFKTPECPPEEFIITLAGQLEYLIRQDYTPSVRVTKLRAVMELTHVLGAGDVNVLGRLATLYMQHNFSKSVLHSLYPSFLMDDHENPRAQRLATMIRQYKPDPSDDSVIPVRRPADKSVKFAVGMMMRHKILEYKCVIFNWDTRCLADSDWKERNNIDRLKYKDSQPFYNVLVEDNSHRYVAQENLYPLAEPEGLQLDDEAGKYFSHFYQTFYVPNAQTENHFPDDGEIRMFFHRYLQTHPVPNPQNIP